MHFKVENAKKKLINGDVYIYMYIHCSKKLGEEAKKFRKPCETATCPDKVDSTHVSTRNTEKKT